MHYYSFHIGDYRSATTHLSNDEDLAYRRLLDMYYDTEKPIPLDTTWVARRIRIDPVVVSGVLQDMFEQREDGFYQPRCEQEINVYKGFSEAGKRGAAKRWSKGGDSPPIHPPITPPIATNNHKPRTNNQQPVNTPDGVSQSVWQEFVNHRKSKKAQVTQLVIDGIQKEADKAGFSLEDALKEVVVRNWQGFKAEWVLPKPTFGDMARVSVAPVQGRDPALLKLDEDKKHTGPPPPEIMAQIRNALKGKVT
jgi:uncharacterized protein YdaU (DUF1376 family)